MGEPDKPRSSKSPRENGQQSPSRLSSDWLRICLLTLTTNSSMLRIWKLATSRLTEPHAVEEELTEPTVESPHSSPIHATLRCGPLSEIRLLPRRRLLHTPVNCPEERLPKLEPDRDWRPVKATKLAVGN